MRYFLVVFNRADRQVLALEEYEDSNVALKERFSREAASPSADIEIVVLGADSREALEKTHSRYFRVRSELSAPV